MNFDFDETEKVLVEGINALFDDKTDAEPRTLESGDPQTVRHTLLAYLRGLGHIGYLGPGPDDHPPAKAQEALAARCPSLFLSVEMSARLFGGLVALHGSDAQKARILPALRQGTRLGALALAETNTSVEHNPIRTKAEKSGGRYVLSGAKGPVINAPVADWIAVAGRLDGRLAFFLPDLETKGLAIGPRSATLGFQGVCSAPVTLEGCPVPEANVIGPLKETAVLGVLRTREDRMLASAALGIMERCFETAASHAKAHTSGGKPIIAFQEVSFMLAEMLTLLQTSRLLAYRAAWAADTTDPEKGALARCAKVFCAESAETVASKALQILGSRGYLRGNPVEEGYRDAKYLQIAGTSSERSRMKIADALLDLFS